MRYCLRCGKILKMGHGYKTKTQYCSRICFDRRRVPNRDELLQTLNKNNNITVTAHLFGTNKQSLYYWMKVLGIKRKVIYE